MENTNAEFEFISNILKVLNDYIQTKQIDIMEERYSELMNQIDELMQEKKCKNFIEINTPLSIYDIKDESSCLIMDELGSYDLENIPDDGLYVRLKLTL
jgi:hypothetical protein